MGEPYAYIDDEFKKASEAKISILEPTFNKGDSVYDTVSVLNKMIFRLDDHLSRFENSCKQMEIKIPYSRQEVKSICIFCILDRLLFYRFLYMGWISKMGS